MTIVFSSDISATVSTMLSRPIATLLRAAKRDVAGAECAGAVDHDAADFEAMRDAQRVVQIV